MSLPLKLDRTVVLVGLMGAGKTAIGRRLAQALALAFRDVDEEIENAAGMTVSEIFARHGEPFFRDTERRFIARLLSEPPHVLATGGGAFINEKTRALIAEKAISVWLKADLDLLLKRVGKRVTRPLLATGDPRETMQRLMHERYPIYATADITVEATDGPHEKMVEAVLRELEAWQAQRS
jgi:shikimate kinase/shikimate kinase/3-dehydroquinate synthase